MSNGDFDRKKQIYTSSHIELNKYFEAVSDWRCAEIAARGRALADKALEVWPYFGEEIFESSVRKSVTGSTPTTLTILGQQFSVGSWRDVLECTLNTIAELEPEKFELLLKNYPRYVGRNKGSFKATRELGNGCFVEIHLSAEAIQRICNHAIQTIDLTSEEWSVIIDNR